MSKLYPIGKHIRIASKCKNHCWYHTDIFEVTGYIEEGAGMCYQTNGKFDCGNVGILNTIHPDFAISDLECEKLDRKLKLQCLKEKSITQ